MKKYFYVPCESTSATNPGFEQYFRLYVQKDDEAPILFLQGGVELTDGWKSKYNADLQIENPYPHLD